MQFHLAPQPLLKRHQGILVADIGGTNVRTGIVEPEKDGSGRVLGAKVWNYELWRHADKEPSKEELLDHLVNRSRHLVTAAGRDGFDLAPFIAIACHGVIRSDGAILRGAQNLPCQWKGFGLAGYMMANLPHIGSAKTIVFVHNDTVVQGLSELLYMRRLRRWGVLTIGTGLGNARFTNCADR